VTVAWLFCDGLLGHGSVAESKRLGGA
jgi:hypothetical protein